MTDFWGFITLDGSVGLYSKEDRDIYHSVYGALTEAYDKFILPANIEDYLKKNNEIKLLDICYGIGYNTKSFLNYILENFQIKNFKNTCLLTENIEAIDTDKVLKKNVSNFKSEKLKNKDLCIEYNEPIDTNNIFCKNYEENINSDIKNADSMSNKLKINITIVDTNLTLIKLSPLIKMFKPNTRIDIKTGISKIDELMKKSPTISPKQIKLKNEVNIILLIKLLDTYKGDFFSEDVLNILNDKEASIFFDKNMVNFAKKYLNHRYNLSYKENKEAFLHNIYYRYITRSYKNTLKILKNIDFNINFVCEDARKTLKDHYEQRYDYIFLDAFTPTLTPMLWTEDFFKQLYNHLSYDGMLLTYSKAATVRSAMKYSNFYVGKIFSERDKKFIGTVATKNPSNIKYQLGDFERGLLNTTAGITYKDKDLNLTDREIKNNREQEYINSNLQSCSNYIKNYEDMNPDEL